MLSLEQRRAKKLEYRLALQDQIKEQNERKRQQRELDYSDPGVVVTHQDCQEMTYVPSMMDKVHESEFDEELEELKLEESYSEANYVQPNYVQPNYEIPKKFNVLMTADQLPDAKWRQEVIQHDLRKQMDDRIKAEHIRKIREQEEEKIIYQRFMEQQERMQKEHDNEFDRRKRDQEEKERQLEIVWKRQEELQQEAIRMRHESMEKKRSKDPPWTKSSSPRLIETPIILEPVNLLGGRTPSPPVPTIRSKHVSERSVSPAVLETANENTLPILSPSENNGTKYQDLQKYKSTKVLSQLSVMRQHLYQEQKRLEEQLRLKDEGSPSIGVTA